METAPAQNSTSGTQGPQQASPGGEATVLNHVKQEHNVSDNSGTTGPRKRTRTRKPFKCSKCDKRFATPKDCMNHKLLHDSKFKCWLCEKAFLSKHKWVKHKQIHDKYPGLSTPELCAPESGPSQCDMCNQIFDTKFLMKIHKVETHKERKYQRRENRPSFECKECGKSLSSLINLRRHMTRHTGISRHQCSKCGKCFGTKSILKSHIMSHTGEKPFKCTVCEKSFARKRTLRDHEAMHSGLRRTSATCVREPSSFNHISTDTSSFTAGGDRTCALCAVKHSRRNTDGECT